MKKHIIKTGLLFFCAGTLAIVGCKKAVEDLKDTATSAEDNVFAESALSSAYDVVDDVSSTDGKTMKNGSTILPSGATVIFTDSIFDTDGDGTEFIIDFGPLGTAPKGILCQDGKYRSGKIRVTLSKRYSEQDAELVAYFADDADAYNIGDGSNMTRLTGQVKIKRTAPESVSIETTDGKATYSKGTIEFFSTKNITRTAGGAQPGSLGDEFAITGNGGGKNRDGDDYTSSITETLVKKVTTGCADTFVKGKIELKNTKSGKALKINFDPFNDAACDKTVEVTLPNGIKQTISVK